MFFNIKILKMSSEFSKNQLFSTYFIGLFITKFSTIYTIFYYIWNSYFGEI